MLVIRFETTWEICQGVCFVIENICWNTSNAVYIIQRNNLKRGHCETKFQVHNVKNRFRALDKGEYLVIIRDNFCKFCKKTYVVTPHLNHLDETVTAYGFDEK